MVLIASHVEISEHIWIEISSVRKSYVHVTLIRREPIIALHLARFAFCYRDCNITNALMCPTTHEHSITVRELIEHRVQSRLLSTANLRPTEPTLMTLVNMSECCPSLHCRLIYAHRRIIFAGKGDRYGRLYLVLDLNNKNYYAY